jgi:5-methyltetrahydropteroyltriglutamate--homocysteine methyltransferase
MPIPTEPIGSIPRPRELIDGMEAVAAGRIPGRELDALYDEAVHDTIERFEATDSPVITDGEQRKPSFVTTPSRVLRPWRPTGSQSPSRTAMNGACRR